MSHFPSFYDQYVFKEELEELDAHESGIPTPKNVDNTTERGVLSISWLNKFDWNHTYINPLAMVEKVPRSHLPSMKWGLKVAKRLAEILLNTLEVGIDAGQDKRAEVRAKALHLQNSVEQGTISFAALRGVVNDITENGYLKTADKRPDNIDDYNDLFQTIGLPAVASTYNQDSNFVTMRTAGPNPLLIRQLLEPLENFPLSNAQFKRVMGNDTLDAAMKEGRVYVCNYELLSLQQQNPNSPIKYLYAPIALFAVSKSSPQQLKPVAIQCQQKPSKSNPIYLADGSYDWLIAKTIVEMADGNYHEAVSHLGRTHLFIEPFVVATGRKLSDDHPVARLLLPHFEGTLFINNAAAFTLVSKGGAVDKLLQGTIESTIATTVAGLKNYPFNESFLPKTFQERGVAQLPDYAYRDDSMLYWEAIKKWVTNYLAPIYADDTINDKDLDAWCRDLNSPAGGRVVGFGENGGTIQRKSYLIDALTQIIYTCSVQHAAVNFPQMSLMSYAPNMPLSCYDVFPTPNPATEKDYLAMLPPLDQAKAQLDLAALLGSVYYTQLGQYEKGHFSDAVTKGALTQFQKQLQDIEKTIQQKNMIRRPYTALMPKSIPQSINI